MRLRDMPMPSRSRRVLFALGLPALALSCRAGALAASCPAIPALSDAAFACAVDRPARAAASNIVPVYPRMLAGANVEGAARVRFIVRADGSVDSASLRVIAGSTNPPSPLATLPHELFALSAARAVRGWRFEPAKRGSHSVAQYVAQDFQFRLTPDPDSALESACRNHDVTLAICIPARSSWTVYGSLAGRLVEGEPGQPIARATVVARDSADPREGWRRAQIMTTTDSAGRFRFDSLPRGTTQLGVYCHHRLKSLTFETDLGYAHVLRDTTAAITLRAPVGECIAPPADTAHGRFQGEAALGFELNAFVDRDQGEGAIEFSPRAWRQLRALDPRGLRCRTPSGWEYALYDISFVGRKIAPVLLSGSGAIGTEFWADSVLRVRRPPTCKPQ